MSRDSLSGRLRNAVTPAATVLPELPGELRSIVRQSIEAVVAIAREIEVEALSRRSGRRIEPGEERPADQDVRDTVPGGFFEGGGGMPPIMGCESSVTDERTQAPDAARFQETLYEPAGE